MRAPAIGPWSNRRAGLRIYLTTQRDGFDFNLAFIPRTFTRTLKEPFETAYMKELFDVGYDMAVKGYPWAKTPPGFTAP